SPRILPCAESVCINCIDEHAKEKHLKCFFCHETHTIPSLGFPINKSLLKILNSIDTNIYRGAVFEHFKSHLKNVEDLVDFLECDLECGKSKIHQYCDGLRNQIDINIDQQIKLLNDTRDELFDELHLYEKECLNNLNQNHDQLESFHQSIEDDKSQLEEDKIYLKKTKISEDILKDKISRVRSTEWKLQKLCRMPQLVRKNTQTLDFESYTEINFNNFIDIDPQFDISLHQLENKNFVLEYIDEDTNNRIVEVRSFQKCNQFYRKYKKPIFDHVSEIFSIVRTCENKILVFEYSKNFRIFTLFNDDLEVLKEKQVTNCFVDIIATQSKIFCLPMKRDTLIIYDWDFNELMVLNKNSALYSFSNWISEFDENEDYLFFREGDFVNIISKESEQMIKSVNLEAKYELIGVDSENFFVKEVKADKIEILSLNGEFVDSINLKNFPKNNILFLLDVNKNFVFYDSTNLKFYLPSEYN
ncbi:unnamed protein product, partial [Brachionus calyciflorus]